MIEVELKLLATDDFVPDALLAVLETRASLSPVKVVQVHDVYMDTRSRSLARAGLSARCRRKGGRGSVQVKPVPLVPELILRRVEMGAPLGRGEDASRAIRTLVEQQLPLKLRGFPIPEVEVRSWRRVYDLLTEAGCRAELSIDSSMALRPGSKKGPTFSEVELEHYGGDEESFVELTQVIARQPGLEPSKMSKHLRALKLVGLPVLSLTNSPPSFGPLSSVDEVARHICSTLLTNMKAFEAGTRAGLDTEYLHKMRVTTRRLRAALVTFAGCFDQKSLEYLLRNFKWLADVLGVVRDLDVQLLALGPRRQGLGPQPEAGWVTLQEVLQRRWQVARGQMLSALDSARYARFVERAVKTFRGPIPRRRGGPPGLVPVAELAREVLGDRVDRVLRAMKKCRRRPRPARMHALRIRGKKLRYACEFFKSLYSSDFKAAIKEMATFQDVLGLFQDNVVLGELVSQLMLEAPEGQGAYLFVLGQLSAASQLGSEAGAEQLTRALKKLGGAKAVSSLSKEAQRLSRSIEALTARS